MAKEKINFEDIKVGDVIEVKFSGTVDQVDSEDGSVRLEAPASGGAWFFPSDYAENRVSFKREKGALIPADATALTYTYRTDSLVFASKGADGSWVDSDGDGYEDTEELAQEIEGLEAAKSVRIYDVRGGV